MFKSIRSFITRFWMASIRRQLILGIALVHAVLMTIFVFDLVDRQSQFLYEQSIAQVEGLAKTLATTSSSWVLARDVAGLEEVLQSQAAFPALRYAMVLTPRGKVLSHTDRTKDNLYLSDEISRELLNSPAELQILVSDNNLIDLAYPILIDDDLIGWARVGIGQEIITAGLVTISRNGVLYTLLAILVGSVFAYFMAKSLTGGLRHLVGVAEGNRLGQRELRTNLDREDEIGLLGRDFNLMLDALEQQEKDLRHREYELRKISDVLPAPVARVDSNNHILFVSAAYERWFGKHPRDVVGKSIQESLNAEIYAKLTPYFQRVLYGETVTFEITNVVSAEETLFGQVTVMPDYDNAGSLCGFYIVIADITERTLAEKELQQSQQQAKNYLDVAAVMLISLDASGDITLINHKGCEMLGLPEEDILGKNWFDNFLPKPEVESVKNYFKQLMAGDIEHVEHYENSIINGQGEERFYAWRNSLVKDEEGRITGVLASADDITGAKQAERDAQLLRDQLIQATKMEAVGHLTAGIAHDFNNLLGVIMGYTELSKEFLHGENNSSIKRYLNEIEKSGNRATELVAQMLSFSRLSPESDGECAPVTLLSPVVKEVVSLLRSTIPTTIELNCQIESPDIKACIEQIQFHQIILNLGINARDAIGEYGAIDITLTKEHINSNLCISCQQEYKGEFVKITVHDSGSGIDEQIVKNVFNPFFTTKEVGKGTGMGLSVVHGLVHKAGGHIQLDSAADKGTTITILLPVVSQIHETTESLAVLQNDDDLTGIRIMVVDDEPAIANMLDDLLSARGAKVNVLLSPLEALKVFEQQPDSVDVVITDETMPGLTGMHLAQKILHLKPEQKIILCTGYSDNITSETAEQAGLSGFFKKPTDMKSLIHKLQQINQDLKNR